ncbi:MAG: TIGR02449 family protein [Motiliproteus sp.]
MSEQILENLEQQIDQLIDRCQQLQQRNRVLEQKESSWKFERNQLLKSRDATQGKVEAMIRRLKAMEQE